MSSLNARVVVWRESPSLATYEQQKWHARSCGYRLVVTVRRDGITSAKIERKRALDGGMDTIATRMWTLVNDATTFAARNWCEANALKAAS